jgi:UDP-3-O-[3-hydroxymyristoyl] glucosamine N-acyltransferase
MAQEGDTTFLNNSNWQTANQKIFLCKAKRLYVHEDVYDLFDDDEKSQLRCELVRCKNPKLEFMKALAEVYPAGTNARIKHEDREIVGVANMGDNITIGAEPLNVERDSNGELHDFTYLGGVRIGDNVKIGANSVIARGALEDTIIEDNVRMDCNVFVGNGALVGAGSIICVGVIIGGGVKIGKNCFIGLGAIINNHIRIGDNVIVGSGAVVIRDVGAMNVVAGVPAKVINDNLTKEERYKMTGCTFPSK